ncbi:hypothetical protein FQN54_001274 [Arachnomyces sp. PD_36]|nr:hypothetical protein FQN54_001274 [Arachnomyces sp. PD_36]
MPVAALASLRISGRLLTKALRPAADRPSTSFPRSDPRLFLLRFPQLGKRTLRPAFASTTTGTPFGRRLFSTVHSSQPTNPFSSESYVSPAPKLHDPNATKDGRNRNRNRNRNQNPWDRFLVLDPRSPNPHQRLQQQSSLAHRDTTVVPKSGIFPMKFFFQFVTTPTADTPGTSILLHFDHKKYLFGNVSEGTQRACVERGARLGHLTEIFLTGKTSWAGNGGMIGMVLTLADSFANSAAAAVEREKEKKEKAEKLEKERAEKGAGKKKKGGGEVKAVSGFAGQRKAGGYAAAESAEQRGIMTLHGGRNLAHTLATGRRFIFRKGMPLYIHEFAEEGQGEGKPLDEPTWSDLNVKVWAMSVPAGGAGSSAPKSPRKRSLEEFEERAEGSTEAMPVRESQVPDQHAKDQLVRQAVVSEMFNSEWRMDSLMEVPLAEVAMPAVMFTRCPETNKLEQYTGPKPGEDEPLPDIKVLVRKPWPGALVQDLPPTSPSHDALSYIIRNHDIRGKFDPQKATAVGVPKGRDYSRLANGESVQSTDGKTVTPDMVLGPPREGRGVAIIELPTVDYVENLVNRPEWNASEPTKGMAAFIWILGPGVSSHPLLQEFVSKWPECQHIVSSPDHCHNSIAFDSAASATIRLSKLDNDRFQTPKHSNVEIPQRGLVKVPVEPPSGESPFIPAERGLLIDVEPKFMINKNEVEPPLNTARVVEKLHRSVARRAANVRQEMKQPEFQKELENLRESLPGGDVEIVALGTGSSLPSKYRNVSATLVRVPGYGNYLLDCGEGTLGQLKRVFNPDELRDILRDLRMIWISHLHADHHLGTVSVIKAWYDEVHDGIPLPHDPEKDLATVLKEQRLFVVSDKHMINWLSEYSSVEDFGHSRVTPLSAASYKNTWGELGTSFHYTHNPADTTDPTDQSSGQKKTITAFTPPHPTLTPLLQSATGLSDLLTVNVSHCQGSKAVSLVFPDDFKISYSGDCRPSHDFAHIGRDSTVLLHEATFEDGMRVDAIAKKHSTTTEALQIGREMGAKNVMLTHFSQRYQKLPRLGAFGRGEKKAEEGEDGEGTTEKPMPVAVAFDYMRVKVKDIACSQAYTPALMKLFEMEEDGDGAGSDGESSGSGSGSAKWREKRDAGRRRSGSG